MYDVLQAACERCGEAVEVPQGRLFDFDCRCPGCAGLLVLRFPDRPGRELITDFHDRPTKADSIETFPSPDRFAQPRRGQEAREDALAAFMEAAGSIDPSPAPAPAPVPASVAPASAAPASAEAAPAAAPPALDDGEGPETVTRHDTADEEPDPEPEGPESGGAPDPYEEAARALDQAMTDSVRKTRRAVRLSDSSLSDGEEELQGLVEVVQVPEGGTGGRGSRTYEREQVAPGGDDRGTGAIDLDWLALIEDAPLDEVDASVSRVIITLPEQSAPTENASEDQKRQFQEAVLKLEGGQSDSLTSLLAPEGVGEVSVTSGGSVDQDTRSWGQEENDAETAQWPQHSGDERTTRPWKGNGEASKHASEDAKTTEWTGEGRPADDKTADWAGSPPGEGKTADWVREAASADEPKTTEWPKPGQSQEATEDTKGWADQPTRELDAALSGTSSWTSGSLNRSSMDRALVSASNPEGAEAGAFRQLYQRLFGNQAERPLKTVLVTSPNPGDGKTTIASNLALVGSRLNGGVVLIDANPLGSGDVLRAFGVRSRNEGLLEALQTEGDPADYALPLKDDGKLEVVPLGIPSSDAEELVGSSRMAAFLTRLRKSRPEALVVIDGSPALSTGARAVAEAVDGVVLVARAGSTPRDAVSRSLEVLGRQRVLGLVLNDAREGM